MRLALSVLAILLGASAVACGDSRNNCSTSFSAEPKLSEIQTQIFNRSCTFSSCHSETNPQPKGNPLVLATGRSYVSLLTVSFEKPSTQRVVPGSPTSSFLLEKLTSDTPTGDGMREPQGADPLCQGEIDTITKWISLGAKNN